MRALHLTCVLVVAVALAWARVAEANISASGNLNFGLVHAGGAPTLTVNLTSNVSGGSGDVGVTITESCSSVSVSPSSGTVPRQGNGPLVVTVTYTASTTTIGAIPTCTVAVTTSGTPPSTSFTVNGTSTASDMTVSPASFPLGNVRWNGGAPVIGTVTITNSGNETIANADLTSTLATNTQFTITGRTNFPIAPAAAGQVFVTFDPTSNGSKNDTLTLALSNDLPGDPNVTRAFTGTGTESNLNSNASLAFGSVNVATAGGATLNHLIDNSGTASLNINRLQITGDPTGDFQFAFGSCTSGQDCTQAIAVGAAPSADAAIILRCDPSTTGAKTATLVITSDDPASPHNVNLTCTGTTPDAVVTPTTLADFGNQRILTTSPTVRTFTINNPNPSGTTAPLIFSVAEPSPDFSITCAPGGCSQTLAPGGSTVTVTVSFRPTVTGPLSTLVTVSSNDASEPTITVAVSGVGVEPLVRLDTPPPVTPPTVGGSLTFAATKVGETSAAQAITITNTGTQDLSVTSITNTNPTDFDVSAPASVTVAAAGSATWMVTCSPNTQGMRTGTISIINNSTNDASVDIAVSCSAIQGLIAVTSATPVPYVGGSNRIDFGPVLLGAARATTVTITNSGNQPVNLGAISFTPIDQGFTAGAPSSAMVAAGGTVTVVVTFTPTLNTQGAAVMNIPSMDWNALAVNVIGDGQDTGLSLSPGPTVDLGTIAWDQTKTQVIRIQNNGQAQASLASITLLNNTGGNFTLTGVPGTLPTLNASGAVGDFLDITVTATPNDTMLGTFTTTLDVRTTLPPPNDMKTVTFSYASTGAGLDITPGTTLDFGGVDVDLVGGRVIPITITNMGNAVLTIASVSAPGGSYTVSGGGLMLIPATESRTMMVTYAPTAEGAAANPETATFVITNAGFFVGGVRQPTSQMISVTGWGIDRHIAVTGDNNQPVLDFGAVYRNPNADDARATKLLQVCNTGEALLDVSMVTDPVAPFDVTSAQQFTVTGAAVAGGMTCVDVTVEFRPGAYGDYASTLTVMNNDNSTPVPMATVSLSGRGIARPVMVTSPDVTIPVNVGIGIPVRLSEILSSVTTLNTDDDETFRIRFEFDATLMTAAHLVGAAPTSIAPGMTERYDLEFVAEQAGPIMVIANVYLDDDTEPHHTTTIQLNGVAVDFVGGGGCDAGGRGASWLLLALGVVFAGRRRR